MSYCTKQRETILDYLKENKELHLTAEQISAALSGKAGKATVYRYLEKLTESGQVRRFMPAGGKSACFQYTENIEICMKHFHFKCDVCGELFHTECDLLSDVSLHISDSHRFLIDSSKTVFYGSCEKCIK